MIQNDRMDIRMIALDLDGTLLNKEKHVSERSRRALAAANAAGVAVVPCSGRALDSIPAEVLGLTGVQYAVSSGGGAAFELSTGRQLVCAPLDPCIVQEVLRITAEAGAWGECYTGGQSFTPAREIPTIRAMLQIVSAIMGRDYKAEKARTLDTLGLAEYPLEQLLQIL
jgi:hydroxymethylpyrimidine pyrophosphatase-like HAD family hydrolase